MLVSERHDLNVPKLGQIMNLLVIIIIIIIILTNLVYDVLMVMLK